MSSLLEVVRILYQQRALPNKHMQSREPCNPKLNVRLFVKEARIIPCDSRDIPQTISSMRGLHY